MRYDERGCHDAGVLEQDRVLYESHPDLGLVLGRGTDLIAAALDDSVTLVSRAKPVQVRFVPGRSVTARFSATVEVASGDTRVDTFVVSVGLRVASGIAIVTAHGRDVAVWRYPADPFLPGLPSVTEPTAAGRLLEQVGIESSGIALRTRAYRPSRRAVVEIQTPQDRVFAKVVRPAKVADLQRLHTSLAQSAPIPMSLGWSETSGIAMLQALGGRSLRTAIEDDEQALPSAGALLDLLGTLKGSRGGPSRPSLVERVGDHAVFLGTIIPDARDRVDHIAHTISSMAEREDRRAIHGDFHASQIMVDQSQITGLVDIDTVSPGEPTDDLANFLAHLAALASARPDLGPRISAYGTELLGVFDVVADPRQLRLRISAALLGYASGPFRVQETEWRSETTARIEAAAEWLDAASVLEH